MNLLVELLKFLENMLVELKFLENLLVDLKFLVNLLVELILVNLFCSDVLINLVIELKLSGETSG